MICCFDSGAMHMIIAMAPSILNRQATTKKQKQKEREERERRDRGSTV